VSGDDPLGWTGGTLDGRVQIETLVGEGGFGYVYRGVHLGFHEPVAVKCLKIPDTVTASERETLLGAFHKEARMLHRLSRKTAGIVQALDVGAATSPRGIWTPYIVMEWLEGHTLEEELASRAASSVPMASLAEAVALLAPAAQALAVAHASDVAHLDLKPANLFLVCPEAGEPTTKVLDFGVARTLSRSATLTRHITQQGVAFTPQYAAPEQFDKRHGKIGPPTDVFALGLIFIELASGRTALDGDSPLQLYMAASNEHVRPSLGASGVEASEAVEEALRRALAVDPAARFADAGAFWGALAHALEGSPALSVVLAPPRVNAASTTGHFAEAMAGASASKRPPPADAQRFGIATGQNRVCTVLVAELRGTEALERALDPDELGEIVARALAALGAAVAEAGGEVVEVAAERVVAAFGLHSDSAGAAERAVVGALGLARAVDELAVPPAVARLRPRVRAGVSTGRVFVRADPGSDRWIMAGPPIAQAARLAELGASGGVVVAHDTMRQIGQSFEVEPLAAPDPSTTQLRGYRVTGVVRHPADKGIVAEVEFHGRPTRFVGRAAELEVVLGAADAALRERRGRMLLVTGPAGVGRSRLLAHASAELDGRGFLLFAAHGSPLHARSSYGLAAALVRTRFGIHDDDPRELAHDKLVRGLRALPRASGGGRRGVARLDPVEIAAQLVRMLGHAVVVTGSGATVELDAAPIEQRIAAAMAALVSLPAAPVALVCDDAHWADPATLDLFDSLLWRASEAPLFVLLGAQPAVFEQRPAWGDPHPQREALELRPLARGHVEEMARDRLVGLEGDAEEVARKTAERAEGSPLALVELLHLLVDRGVIDASGARWSLRTAEIDLSALPTTVQGLVQARLDALDPRARDLLCEAAVVGRTFWDGAVAALEGVGREGVGPIIAETCARGLVRRRPTSTFPDETEYVFAESALQEVAYGMLGRAARRELHGGVARWLEARSLTAAAAGLVARHHERAAALVPAMRAYVRAGAHALGVGQGRAAVECYERACRIDAWITGETDVGSSASELFVEWQRPEDARMVSWTERVAVRAGLGDVRRRLGEVAEAEQAYEQARLRIVSEERRTLGGPDPLEAARWEARLDFRLSLVRDVGGRAGEARALAERATVRADAALCPAEERAEMLAHLAGILLRAQEREASIAAARRGIEILRSATIATPRWREAAAWLVRALGGGAYHAGRLVRAERLYLQAARILGADANPYAASRAVNNAAAVRFQRGELPSARDAFRHALELAERSGDLWATMTVMGNLGEVEHHLGNNDAAGELLEEAVCLGERMGARAELVECYRLLAQARHAKGEVGGALEAASRALATSRVTGAGVYGPALARTVARLCAGSADGELETRRQGVARELFGFVDALGDRALLEECRTLVGALP
jgi:class 3 adenylate cyclase/tetratricopeptide (TPR) repeat protein